MLSLAFIISSFSLAAYNNADLLSWFKASAEGTQEGPFLYTVENGEASITGYDYSESLYYIPDTLGGYPVTSIGDYALSWSLFESAEITIPDSVKYIGEGAFSGGDYYLTGITLPDNLEYIGAFAFSDCYGISEITIPSGVTSINHSSFSCCFNLERVTILGNITNIGTDAFYECDSLTNIYFAGTEEDWNAITVEEGNEILDSVTVCCESTGPVIKKHGELTFEIVNNSAKVIFNGWGVVSGDVIIPPKIDGYPVTAIDKYAFGSCDITSISIPDSVTSIGEYAFDNCDELKSIVIPEGITEIANGAFFCCDSLTEVTIPDGVVSIGEYAFEDCCSLTGIELPESLESIAGSAFSGCVELKSVHIPDNVEFIADDAFAFCCGIEKFTVTNNDEFRVVNGALCSSDTVLFLPANNSAKEYRVSGFINIGEYAFFECDNLEYIYIDENVESLYSSSFAFCDNLKGIVADSANTRYLSDENGAIYEITDEFLVLCSWPVNSPASSITLLDGSVFYPMAFTGEYEADFVISESFSELLRIAVVENLGYDISELYYMIPEMLALSSFTAFSVSASDTLFSTADGALYDKEKTVLLKYPIGSEKTYFEVAETAVPSFMSFISSPFMYYNTEQSYITPSNLTVHVSPDVINMLLDESSCDDVLTGLLGARAVCSEVSEDIAGAADEFVSNYFAAYSDDEKNIEKLKFKVVSCDGSNPIAAGTCGENLTWTLNQLTGELVISGEGEMQDFNAESVPPWNSYSSIIKSVVIEDGVTRVGNQAFYCHKNISVLSLGNTLTSIGARAFMSCESLESINIPDSVTVIEDEAFAYCLWKLTNITLGDNLTTIGYEAFTCSNISELFIPDSVITIGEGAFSANAIKDLTIGNGVTSIGKEAFAYGELESVILPAGVTTIGEGIFAYNYDLAEIYYIGTQEEWEAVAIGEDNAWADSVICIGKLTVTLNANGGYCNVTKKTISYGNTYSSLPIPERSGYVFEGWYSEIDGGEKITYDTPMLKTADHEIHAHWTPDNYNVTFELNGGILSTDKTTELNVTFGKTYGSLPIPQKSKCNFDGWYLSDGVTEVTSESIVQTAADHTLTAKWSESQILYVEIVSLPDKTNYVLGDTLDADGLVLNVTYDNGETVEVAEGYTCSPEKLESSGVCAVVVNYEGFENEFNVNVSKGNPINISIASSPYKTEYLVGEALVTRGLVLLAEYADGTTENIYEGYECSVSVLSKTGTQKITVTYEGCKAAFNVTVINGNPVGVTIQNPPKKLQYYVGEELDTTGLVLNVEYPNSVFKTVTDGFMADCDLNSIGTKTVNVTYSENGTEVSTSFTVEVTVAPNVTSVWAADVFASSGETVSVPVYLNNNPGFMGFSIMIDYDDSALTPLSVNAGDMLNGGTIDDSIGGALVSGKLKITYYADQNIYEDGTMFTVDFAVNENAPTGDYQIGISYLQRDTFDENYENVKLVCAGSLVSVSNKIEDSKLKFYSYPITVNAGDELRVPLYINNTNGLTDFEITLNFNSKILEFKEIDSQLIDEVVDNGNGTITLKCHDATFYLDNVLFAFLYFDVAEYIESTEILKISCNSAVVNGAAYEPVCSDVEITVVNPHADEPAVIYSDERVLLNGDYIDIPVYINNNHGIMGFGMNVSYDSEFLEPISAVKGKVISKGTFSNNIGTVQGNIKIFWSNTENVTDNGLLYTLRFKVLDNGMANIPLSISYSQVDTYNEKWEDVVLNINIGTIKIKREYTATFMADGVIISTQKFTIDTEKLVEPEIPPQKGYIASWEYYQIKEEDLIINARYDSPTITMISKHTLNAGEDVRLLPSCNFEVTRREWSSSKPKVAAVDNRGNVTAIKEGKCTIRVTCYGEDSFGNEIKVSESTKIVVKEKLTADNLKEKFRAAFDEFFEVKLHDFMENLKNFIIEILRVHPFTKNQITVSFDSNGGYISETSKTVSRGNPIGDLPIPSKTNYSFEGWYTEASGGTQVTSETVFSTAADVTLYAQWSLNKGVVSFNANGGSVETLSKTVNSGEAYGTLPTPTRTGYNFTGWYTALSGGTEVTPETVFSGSEDVVLYARWSLIYYTVHFNANGGTVSKTYKIAYYGKPIETLPTPTRAYYTFDGWYTEASGGTLVTSDTFFNRVEDITLYAHWNLITSTVSFNANGGTVEPSSKTVDSNGTYGELPVPVRTGYDFLGWYTDAAEGIKVTSETVYNSVEDSTLYAHWALSSFTLNFDANGGTVSESSKTAYYETALGALPTPSRTYYTFNGWFTEATGGTEVTAETAFSSVEDITIYAQWTLNSFVVTFDANGGTVDTAELRAYCGQALGALPTPALDYYTFDGWYTAAESDGTEVTSETVYTVAENITLYAHWTINPVSDWVLASELPSDAQVVAEKWTYTKTETKESYNAAEEGYNQISFRWVKSGSGTHYSASFPAGFNKNNTLYKDKKYNNSAIEGTENDTTKRVVSEKEFHTYIYWHWMYDHGGATPYDRTIMNEKAWGTDGYYYDHFTAFESKTNYGKTDSNGKTANEYFCNRNNTTDGSWWWFRFTVYKQTYEDFKKLYIHQKITTGIESSDYPSGNDISDIKEWIQYRKK